MAHGGQDAQPEPQREADAHDDGTEQQRDRPHAGEEGDDRLRGTLVGNAEIAVQGLPDVPSVLHP